MAPSTNKTAAFENYPGALLTRGNVQALSVGTGVNTDVLVECGGDSTLVVEADQAASASGDLSVSVNPVDEDQDVYPLAQPAVQTVGPTLASGRTYFWGKWDVTSQQRVRIRFTNNNVGTEDLDYSWRLA